MKTLTFPMTIADATAAARGPAGRPGARAVMRGALVAALVVACWGTASAEDEEDGGGVDCTYEQATHTLTCTQDGETVVEESRGVYSGRGDARNDPDAEARRNLGPIPQGDYEMSGCRDGRPTADTVILTPDADTDTHGRGGFLIHGDNRRGDASEGCIIAPRAAREAICGAGSGRLHVTSGRHGAQRAE